MRNAYEDKTESATFLVPKLKSKGHNSHKAKPEKMVYGAIELDSDAITSSEKDSFTFYGALTDAAWPHEPEELSSVLPPGQPLEYLPVNNNMTVEEQIKSFSREMEKIMETGSTKSDPQLTEAMPKQ